MKLRGLSFLASAYLFLSFIFFMNHLNISGFAFLDSTISNKNYFAYFGFVFLMISLLLFIVRIRPKSDFTHLTIPQRTFRKKLVNLLEEMLFWHTDHSTNNKYTSNGAPKIDPKKIAYMLPQYERVNDTGEYIPGHGYKVYRGQKGNKVEYFTVDTHEPHEVHFGDTTVLLPAHIDIQKRIDKNIYKSVGKERIDWRKMMEDSEVGDIIEHYSARKKK